MDGTPTKSSHSKHMEMNTIFDYKKTGKYPRGMTESEKRNLRKRAKSFLIHDEKLYFIPNEIKREEPSDVEKSENAQIKRLVLCTTEERLKAISEFHIDAKGTHIGRERLSNLVTEKYYWVGISSMVRDFIRRCAVCQANRLAVGVITPLSLPVMPAVPFEQNEEDFNDVEEGSTFSSATLSSSFHPTGNDDTFQVMKVEYLPTPIAFWEIVEMCVYGPYLNEERYYYIIVFMDAYSHWPEAYTVENVTSSVITHLLLCLISRFGLMQNFAIRDANVFQKEKISPSDEALKSANLEVPVKNVSCQETDGAWQEITEHLQSFVQNNPDAWMKCLDFALLPHRISRGDRAEYTPAFLTYGRELFLPQNLSHRYDLYSTNADPHLTPDQMSFTQNEFLKVYREQIDKMSSEVCNDNDQSDLVLDTGSTENSHGNVFKTPETNTRRGRRLKRSSLKMDTLEDEDDDETYSLKITRRERTQKRNALKMETLEDEDDTNLGEKNDAVRTTRSTKSAIKVENTSLDSDKNLRSAKKRQKKKSESDDFVEVQGDVDMDTSVDISFNDDDSLEHNYANSPAVLEKVNIDKFYEAIKLYLTERKYLLHSTEHFKRVIRKARTQYQMKDNLLYFIGDKNPKKVADTFDKRMELLYAAHVDKEGTHRSKRYMMEKLSSAYSWKGLTVDCEAYALSCQHCKCGKTRKTTDGDSEIHDEKEFVHYIESEELIAKEAENYYGELFMYLQKESFPQNCESNDMKVVKRLAKKFTLENGILYYKRNSSGNKRCLELSSRDRRKIMKEAHDKDLHHSVSETLDTLSQHYLWWGMKKDVETFIRHCCNKKSSYMSTKQLVLKKKCSVFKKYIEKMDYKTIDYEALMDKTESKDIEDKSKTNKEANVQKDVEEGLESISPVDSEAPKDSEKQKSDLSHVDMETKSHSEKIAEEQPSTSQVESETFIRSEEQTSDSSQVVVDSNTELNNINDTKTGEPEAVVNASKEGDKHKTSDSGQENVLNEVVCLDDTDNNAKQMEVIETAVIVENDSETVSSVVEPIISISENAEGVETVVVEQNREREEIEIHLTSEPTEVIQRLAQQQPQNFVPNQINIVTADANQNKNILQTLVPATDLVTAAAVNSILPEGEQIPIPEVNIISEGMPQQMIATEEITSPRQVSVIKKILEQHSVAESNQIQSREVDLSGDEDDIHSDHSDSDYHPEEDVENLTDEEQVEKEEVKEEEEVKPVTDVMTNTEQRGPAAFKCEICNKRIRGSVKYKVHMYQHTGVKPFSCQFCNKKFTNPKTLKLHSRKHTGVRPYLCNICGKDFTLVGSLRAHIKIHESGGNIQVHCVICNRTFASKNRYDRHMKFKHPPEPVVYACEPCNKTFTTARSLKRHTQSQHLLEKNHQCDVCGKQFYRKEYLNAHKIQHQQGNVPRRQRRPRSQVPVQNEMQLSAPYTVTQSVVEPQMSMAQAVYDHDLEGGYYTITTETNDDDQQVTHTLVYNYPAVEYEVECGSSAPDPIDPEALSAINLLAQASVSQGY